MDPLTILTIGSFIWKGISSILGGNAAKKAADYNALVSDQLAQDAIDKGRADEQMYRQGVKSLMGAQRADFAGQNVEVDTGTPVDVAADTAYLGEQDAQQIRLNAQREAWGYKAQGQGYRQQGAAAQRSGYFDAASAVLGGSASLLQAKYGWGTRRPA
jgi:hypothetical protein